MCGLYPQARAPKPDGIGPPEKVEFASAEASTVQYIGLLTVAIVAAVLLAKKAFADGEVHWLPLLGTLVAGYCTYEGVYYLRLQNYVNTVQRPDSRVSLAGCCGSQGQRQVVTAAAMHCSGCTGFGEGVA
jgi:hypothetical protein